ncbi:MAG TPA: lactonase family protein [Cyclobacteriaceae bacterium]|nr:lactonase family protein [Cyclobacteriaceae bacterium]
MRTLMIIFIMTHFLSAIQAQKPNELHLLIGTYSTKDNVNGIHVYRFNTQTGEFNVEQPVTELANASYLAVSADGKNVYAVSEGGAGKGGVNAYSFDPSTGALTFLNSTNAEGPCYVSLDHKKKFVFVGNYGGGSLLSVPVNADGSLGTNVQTIQHQGSSVNKQRQDKPHVHSVVLSPDDRYLMVPDLGTDKVNQYKVDVAKAQALTPAAPPFAEVMPGGGPRHLTFHPNGKYAYLVLEMEGKVVVFDYKDGNLTTKQSITMLNPDFKGKASAADIHVSPDGKFLYASNRGDANEIVIYSIDKNGKLTLVGHQSVLGKTPRNFAIDPSGNFLLVANQDTDEVIIFRRDQKKGLLTPTGKKIEVGRPVCLKFTQIVK